jgi:hypothetical protein
MENKNQEQIKQELKKLLDEINKRIECLEKAVIYKSELGYIG